MKKKTFVWVPMQVKQRSKLLWYVPGMAEVLAGEGTDSGSPFGRCGRKRRRRDGIGKVG